MKAINEYESSSMAYSGAYIIQMFKESEILNVVSRNSQVIITCLEDVDVHEVDDRSIFVTTYGDGLQVPDGAKFIGSLMDSNLGYGYHALHFFDLGYVDP